MQIKKSVSIFHSTHFIDFWGMLVSILYVMNKNLFVSLSRDYIAYIEYLDGKLDVEKCFRTIPENLLPYGREVLVEITINVLWEILLREFWDILNDLKKF